MKCFLFLLCLFLVVAVLILGSVMILSGRLSEQERKEDLRRALNKKP